MKFSILTLFPEMFDGPLNHSIVKRAQEDHHISIQRINIRDFGIGKHKIVDDTPYGGGIGMVMRPDVIVSAIEHTLEKEIPRNEQRVILMSARGATYSQPHAVRLSRYKHIIVICGHYEGVDERVNEWIDEELSLGDFITTGGELPTMLLIDSIARLVPGVLKPGATDHESFSKGLQQGATQFLEYPHYTKPSEYRGLSVPEVLLSGNHKKIDEWRKNQSYEITKIRRPDLLKSKS